MAAFALTHATYAAKTAGGMSATAEMARREELLPIPFAKLMAVFQDPNLNVEWNPNLIKQSFLTLGGLEYGHQEYHLPWPFNNREMLFRCEQTEHPHEAILVKTCYSEQVDPPGAPAVAPGNVRGRIVHSRWDFRALADGTTRQVRGARRRDGVAAARRRRHRPAHRLGEYDRRARRRARRLQLPPPRASSGACRPGAAPTPRSRPPRRTRLAGSARSGACTPPSLPPPLPSPSRADARAPPLLPERALGWLPLPPPRSRPPPPPPARAPLGGGDDDAALRRHGGLSVLLALAALAAWRRYADARPRKMTRALSADVLELLGGAAPIELLASRARALAGVRLVIVVGRSWSRTVVYP